jgi:hypothetical protein
MKTPHGSSPPITCNLRAIRDEDRPFYESLSRQLRAAITDSRELPDGYSIGLCHKSISIVETTQWIALERLCCPFLSFQIEASGESYLRLTMRGPAGTKAILRGEFIEKGQSRGRTRSVLK